MPRLQELELWRQELTEQQEQLRTRLEPLLLRRDQLRAKLELVTRLLELEAGKPKENAEPSSGEAAPSRNTQPVGSGIQAAVHNLLREAGHPMHVRDIRDEL